MAGLDRETLDAILSALHDFAGRELTTETLLALDLKDEFPEAIVRAMCGPDLGIHMVFIPEEFGGMGGDATDVYRCCEALARIDLGVATGLLATCLGSDPIRCGGTPEQQAKWLGRIAEEGILFAYGATEPAAGSDLAALRSTATPIEENGAIVGYMLNGRKQWISNGGVADALTFLASTPAGPSWFIVERGAPGLSAGKPEDKHGIRASNTAALWLEDVRVDPDRLVGGVEGQGLQQAQAVFGYTRLMVAAFGLGGGWAALDRAIPYAKDRIQGGTPLSEKQGYTHKLIVPHAVRLEAARAYIEDVAETLGGGAHGLPTEGAIAKYMATEAGNAAAEASIQALGGYGYTREYMVEKIKRDVRITTIYEGTSEIMEMTIARDRWQQHLKTRGQHYHQEARALESIAGRHPESGAGIAALGLHALAEVLERAREARLTRHQHVLFRIGELIAWAEVAGAAARRAADTAEGRRRPKGDERFDATALAAIARVFAREAALRVVTDGIRWLHGADGGDVRTLGTSLGFDQVLAAQAGLVADMDQIADVLFGRSATALAKSA